MVKENIGIVYRLKHLFVHHPWLKIISLILAVIVWFYARDQISMFNY